MLTVEWLAKEAAPALGLALTLVRALGLAMRPRFNDLSPSIFASIDQRFLTLNKCEHGHGEREYCNRNQLKAEREP